MKIVFASLAIITSCHLTTVIFAAEPDTDAIEIKSIDAEISSKAMEKTVRFASETRINSAPKTVHKTKTKTITKTISTAGILTSTLDEVETNEGPLIFNLPLSTPLYNLLTDLDEVIDLENTLPDINPIIVAYFKTYNLIYNKNFPSTEQIASKLRKIAADKYLMLKNLTEQHLEDSAQNAKHIITSKRALLNHNEETIDLLSQYFAKFKNIKLLLNLQDGILDKDIIYRLPGVKITGPEQTMMSGPDMSRVFMYTPLIEDTIPPSTAKNESKPTPSIAVELPVFLLDENNQKYQVERVKGDGDCFFTALKTSRAALVNKICEYLTLNADNDQNISAFQKIKAQT